MTDLGEINVFDVDGQSNGLGQGEDVGDAPVVAADQGVEVRYHDIINPIVEPVGVLSTGSAWSAFCATLFPLTGIPTAIINTCVGGTNLLHTTDPGTTLDWSPDGTLTADADYLLEQAIMALANAGYRPRYRGTLWVQGEGDANIYPGTAAELEVEYEAGLIDFVDRHHANLWFADDTPYLWISRTGKLTTGDTSRFQAVRNAQQAAADNDDRIVMGYTGALGFVDADWMVDEVHYKQVGLNAVGVGLAESVYATIDNSPLPVRRRTNAELLELVIAQQQELL